VADIHVSLLSRENRILLTRASEERAKQCHQELQLAISPLGGWFLLFAEPDIHLLSQAPGEPSQKIEFVFTASPETIRAEPLEWNSFAQSATGGTWQPARCLVLFLCRRRRLCRRAAALFWRYEVALLTVYRQQVRDHLPSHRKSCAVGVSFL
jgi:hypothetical protein